MRSLSELFQKKNLQKPKNLDEKTVLYVTKNIVLREFGNNGIANITPVSFKQGDLVLGVRGSLWRNEVEMSSYNLKKGINEECGLKVVKKIIFRESV